MIRPASLSRSRHPAALAALLALVALVAACSPSTGPLGTPSTPEPSASESLPLPSEDATPDLSSPSPSPSPSATRSPSPSPSPDTSLAPSPTPRRTASPTPAAGSTVILRNYYVMTPSDGEPHLVPVLREVPKTVAVASAAIRELLDGPNPDESAAGIASAIPGDTSLLGITIDDGIATIDLSREFESGGGSESMFLRLAQVVYTLTQFGSVDGVLFRLDGDEVTTFGGEGIVLDGPVGRADYREQLSPIAIERPAWGASLGNPGTVSGVANVFEATFRIEIRDAGGAILAQRQVMASCGTGCWGTWRVPLDYAVRSGQWGTVRVFVLSARDGSVEDLTEYKVWLTPAGG